MTPSEILKKINNHETKICPRLNRLYEAYIGKYPILNTTKKAGKPNNKLVNNFARKIVNDTVGYYLGEPIKYECADGGLEKQINLIAEYNDDAFHNTTIGEDLSTFGVAAELLYHDEDKNVRYAKINPMFLYLGYSSDVEKNLEYAIRWYDIVDDDGARTRYIEVYDAERILYYEQKRNSSNLVFTGEKEHYFKLVPINVFENNKDCIGDYENVLSLIDAYNVMQSENVNDFQKFADAILFLKNASLAEKEAENLRDKNILETYEETSDAQWLVKSVNDAYVENMKNRLKNDIYELSNTVNMSDESFGSNLSGVAIKYKLMSMENRVSKTVRFFQKALQRRFEMICNYLNFRGGNYDYMTIKAVFKRNIPSNNTENATIAQQLSGIVSNKTLLSLFPFVTDIEKEMLQLKDESAYKDIFEIQGDDV